ncbi:MAG: Tyrosine recombinase XerC [Eubacterium sp.]|uniref:tyrosine-type recombinase/integrase n=1 Tax=Eubacterium TaxID=1730 RepID=UPI00087E68A8|nr:tyrosine-type recombinase/integrase [Eubacterium maltosivorans]WPK80550.1 Tyrosine recombinase XerC [Eubacterium maltosivorans]SDO21710.1 Site-specific recombinase XerD [Eubacterium maltosivorans]
MKEQRRNIYKRKDNRYEGRYIVGYEGVYGKALYRSVYAHTYEEAVEVLEEAEERVREEVELQRLLRRQKTQQQTTGILQRAFSHDEMLKVVRTLTLQEWMIEWLEGHKKNTIRATSYMRYYNVIYKHIIPQIGSYNLLELTPDIIQKFVKYLCENAKNDDTGLSPATVRSYMMILKSALELAVDQELMIKNPCRKVSLPPKRFHKPVYLEPDECKRLEYVLLHTDDNPKSVAILMALKTGMRLGELAALKWGDVDFSNRVIHVRHSLQRVKTFDPAGPKTKLVVSETKTTNSVRDIPMNNGQYQYLKAYHRMVVTESWGNINENTFVFQNQSGTFIDPRVYQQYFKVVLKKAKVKEVNFHALRHTFATIAASKNMQISVLSRILGHSNAALTLQLYIHSITNQDRAEMSKVDWEYSA